MRLGLAIHDEPPLLAGDDLVHDLVAAAAAGRGAAVVADLRHAASAGGPDSTTNVSIGEGVAVTDEHRRKFVKDSYVIVKIKFNKRALA